MQEGDEEEHAGPLAGAPQTFLTGKEQDKEGNSFGKACKKETIRTRRTLLAGAPQTLITGAVFPLGTMYNLFPLEILAIQRIRREQGLPTPEIDHPLMQTPLAHPPEVMPHVEDELLNQVIAKVRKELPIGDPW